MKFISIFYSLFFFFCNSKAQNNNNRDLTSNYSAAIEALRVILSQNGSFKDAVFISEETFFVGASSVSHPDENILFLKTLCNEFTNSIQNNYHWKDSINYIKNLSILLTISDTSYILTDTSLTGYLPFTYSFTDPFGQKDWSNNFVTKLLATHEGNCHSLAYLYKILADEVGAKCWLALAPGHIYIKNYSEKIGWYNTELTSGTFPTDAWVMVSGYVNPQAIKSGMYMDTLSNRQAIALCVLDLAKGYEFQTHNYYDGFILKCCDLVLQYHPVNPIALLLKAETLKKVFIKEQKDKYPKPTTTFTLMQEAYAALAKLGYREMPEEMYKRWLIEMTEEKNIYQNKQLQEK